MAKRSKGPVRIIALCFAAVVLLASQGTFWNGSPGSASLRSLGPGGRQARAGTTLTTYLPFLSKTYALGASSLMGIDMGDPDDDTKARLVAEAGAKWIRISLHWSRVEPSNTTPGNFNWSEYDQMLARVAQWGLSPIVVVSGNPSWAADTSCGPINRTSLQEFGQFLAAAVSRYGRPPYQVKYWEIYNEPDNSNSTKYAFLGGCWGNNGREYGQMLQVAYPAVKTADPGANVVLGSLAYDNFTEVNGPFVRGFLDDVLDPRKGNGGPFFDILGFHYYYLFRSFWEPYGKDLIGKANFLRSRLASYALSKPMILTEVGMPSGTAGTFQGTDDMQSDYVVKAFVRSMAANLKVAIWFSLMDFDNQKLGLVDNSLAPKRSYEAFEALAPVLSGAIYNRLVDSTTYPGVEGYVFTVPGGTTEKWVLWASGDSAVMVTLPGLRVRVVDKLGWASILKDGDDGQWDGWLNVRVTSSPVYLEVIS